MEWTLIVGASGSVGQALTKAYAKAKEPLLLHYCHNKNFCESVESEAPLKYLFGNLDHEEGVQSFLDQLSAIEGKIKRLIITVGPFFLGSVSKTPFDIWKKIYQMNFFAPVQIISSLIERLKQSQASVLCFGVAGLDRLVAETYSSAYFNAKFSLLQYVRSLAKELIPHNTRINCLSPGYIEGTIDEPKCKSSLLQQRFLSMEELVEATFYLCNSQMLTGQNLELAGGARL